MTDDWLHFLYQRMNIERRALTTSRPVGTELLWIKHVHCFDMIYVAT